jgi:hypothetical protein
MEARVDPASERFDDELTAAVNSGAVSPAIARRLRHWHRAAVHAVAEHARLALPPAIGAVTAAADAAHTAVADGEWRTPVPEGNALTNAFFDSASHEPLHAATEPPAGPQERLLVAGLTPYQPAASA